MGQIRMDQTILILPSQFQRMTTMYHFSTPQATREFKELSEISGRHHVLTCGNLVLNIDLK
jgi:hypothetical protein